VIEAFYEVLSGDGSGILGPLWQRGSPNWGVWNAAYTPLLLPSNNWALLGFKLCSSSNLLHPR